MSTRRRARRRLIGAIVLALAAAVVRPMLLESDPKPLGEDVSVKIPPQDNDKFVNRLSDKERQDRHGRAWRKQRTGEAPSKADAPAQDAPPDPKAGRLQSAAPEEFHRDGGTKDAGRVVRLPGTASPPRQPARRRCPPAPPASTGSAAMPAPVDTAKAATMEGFSCSSPHSPTTRAPTRWPTS